MKRAAWALGALLAGVTLLGLLMLWLTTTTTGFVWLAKQATPLSEGRLVLEGVEGHLATSVHIRKMTLTTDTQRITLQQVKLEWQPRSLWHRLIEIDLLAAQHAQVETLAKDPTPPAYPVTLRWLFDIRVAAWDVATLDVVDAGQTLQFSALRGTVDGRGERFDFTAAARTPWADVAGKFGIHKDAPFKLQGQFNATRSTPVPTEATLGLTGELAAIDFRLDALAEGMTVMADGQAAPFEPVRLPRLLVAGEGIDPRQFAADAPRADLAFSGVFEGRPDERLLGTFSLSNRLAGRVDQDRLPLANLTGAVLGDARHADFSALSIDLGAAGQFVGDGQWRDGRFSVNLASPRVNLAGLHRDLNSTRIKANLKLAGDATRQTLDADVSETWGQGRFTLSHADAALRLESANFSGQAGRLTAKGVLQLDAGRAFSAEFDASQINPARFGKFPRGQLNARGEASGSLAPKLRLQAQFTLPPGDLDGRPVSGKGRVRYENQHLADADVDLNLAGNRAKLLGAYGRAGDRLNWDIDAPALARLNLGLAGRLTSRGSVSGDPAAPQIEATVAASGLRLPGDIAADTLNLELNLQAAATGAFTGQLDARGVTLAGQRLSAVRAKLQGRRNAHTLTLDARLPDWQVTASLAGGLDAQQVWRGQLNQARAEGPWPMLLTAPATLLLSREQQQVSQLALTVAGGRLTVEQFNLQDAQWASSGTLANLPLAPLLTLLDTAPPFTTDLRVNGNWNLRAGTTLDGTLRLRRHSGDVRMKDPVLNLGLTTVELDLDAVASRVSARVEATSREAGQLRAEGQATLARVGAGFTLPRSAPLAWTAQFDVSDLRLLRPFLPVTMRADARLNANLTGSGSLAAPRIDGRIDASQIRFAMPEAGIAISDGTLKLLLADDRVRVQEGELIGPSEIQGGGGRIVVSGEAQWKNPQAGLTLNFEKFAVTNRSDRRVVVSGATRLQLDPKRLQLTGELTADRARLEMPEASRPTLSSDVVVVGRPPPEKTAAQRIPLELDLKLNLGKDFLFKGGGLDARLGGQLRVFTVNTVLRGEGRIQVEEGRYAAYAQTLDIERGVLNFIGPIENPGLDILAVRKTPTVKVGVQVRGTVQRPLVTLYSDPPLPDTEKLAWLVLGHGLENGGQQEFALLQIAAGALLSQAESVSMQAQLAETLRIDSFGVRGGEGDDLATTVVSVGKRLSSRATLSYEQSLDGLNQVVKVLYQLSPRVRLEAQAGQPSSFDAFYTREYD
ncbi:MAG: translocation/assembly module TamB domain-containing protein [Thiobacillus sp.]|uniref:translocation/assembly module TamB domain-containing protein n=1 Tax=Thiobacillus sp. TaxID=924 RepID=UPI002733E98C|nr:translocation/assembly module TamB domain-containing protein [Thiobacillus sp.]MDP3583558.1 translocation/assembly module TamB domain-containing protein [Thiobacillus sp.]